MAELTLLVRDGTGVMTKWTATRCDLSGIAYDDPGYVVLSVPVDEWHRVRLIDPLGGDDQ